MFLPTIGCGVEKIKQKMDHSLGLPFQKVLPESTIDASVHAEKVRYRKRVFSPAVTVWTLLSQMLAKDVKKPRQRRPVHGRHAATLNA